LLVDFDDGNIELLNDNFQVFDGLQATFAGIFRGLKYTKIIMIGNFVAFWLIAIPLGCVLALNLKMNLMGFWYALILAIIVLCIIMYANLIRQFKKRGV
jgi:MATE family multidrug resistance protein